MERIAIISDIHGNLEALKAVLEDMRERRVNKIYCLGDIIAKGTHSKECLDLIFKNCEVVLKGNCEEILVGNIAMKSDLDEARRAWNRNKLSDEDLKYLVSLPYCHEFYLSGRLVRLFHATPKNIEGIVGNEDDIESLYSLFLSSENTLSQEKADIIVYGHIHTQSLHRIYNRCVLNAGSVGNSIDLFRNDEKDGDVRNTSLANYLVLSGKLDSTDMYESFSYEFVQVPYDVDKELGENADNIEFEAYETELRTGKYRDMARFYRFLEIKGIDRGKIKGIDRGKI